MRAILFPGQGAQFVGMGRDFCEQFDAARQVFLRAEEVLGLPLRKLCFEGPAEKLAETDVCQPAILTCSAAIQRVLETECGQTRDRFHAAAGLSLGEYTALWFAGALGFEDAVRLVRVRGRAMQRASEQKPSGMASLLGADEATVQRVCERRAEGQVLVAANFLAPGNTVVSGESAAIQRVVENSREDGVRRAVPLSVAGAFHSPLMQPAVEELEHALEGVVFQSPEIPVVANVSGEVYEDAGALRPGLLRQVVAPVLWERSMRTLLGKGVREFLEPGPGSVLSGLLRQIDRNTVRANVGTVDEMNGYSRSASGEEASNG